MNGEKYIRYDKRRGTYSVRISGYGKGKEVFSSPANSFEDAVKIRNEFLIKTYGDLDFLNKLRYPKQVKKNRYVLSKDGTYYEVYTSDEKTCFLIDSDDYETICNITWFKLGKYIASKHYGQLHRFILGITDKETEIDHINCNKLDNRKSNLREATHKENCRNRGKRSDKRNSNYKGVVKSGNKYYAELGENGNIHRSQRFDNEEDAAVEYNRLALKYHKEFANLNKIQ